MKIVFYVSSFVIAIGLIRILVCLIKRNKIKNVPIKEVKEDANFCILIPARNESKVIETLLSSIMKQTYLPSSIYVVVEDNLDPTVEICKRYQANVFVRTTIEGRRRKGYALDEVLKSINKNYDAYVILDADNILDENFLKEMNETYKKGYDIGVGYRNCKNGNESIFAATSALTFSMINTLSNEVRVRRNKNITVSGTGFYIRGNWIKKWNGYPFHSLTEDYELSLYATLHNMTSTYNEKAIFYDEQPVTYKETIKQRVRWIRGYFDSRKEYVPLLMKAYKNTGSISQYQATIGVKPYVWIVVGLVIAFFGQLGILFYQAIVQSNFVYSLSFLGILFGSIYGVLFIFTLILLMLERKKLNLCFSMKLKALFFNPIFLVTYVYCALKAVLKKEITWDTIIHQSNNIS